MYLRRVKLDKMRDLIRNQPSKTPVRKAPEPPPSAANYTPPFGMTSYNANNWPQDSGSNPGAANLPYPINPHTNIKKYNIIFYQGGKNEYESK